MNSLIKSLNMFRFGARLARTFTTEIADNIKGLVSKNKVVVFMKGVPEEPRCGFSNAVVQILRIHGVSYDAHDVLNDEALRQGKLFNIKSFSAIYIYSTERYIYISLSVYCKFKVS